MAEIVLVSLFWLLVLLSPVAIFIALIFLIIGLFNWPRVFFGVLNKQDQDYYTAPEIDGETISRKAQWVAVPKGMLTYLLYEQIPLNGTFIIMRGMLCAINDGDYIEYERREVRRHLYHLNNNCHWLFMFSLASLLTALVGLQIGLDFQSPQAMTDLITSFWPVLFVLTAIVTGVTIWLRVYFWIRKIEKVIARMETEPETETERKPTWLSSLTERAAQKLRLDELSDFWVHLRQYLVDEWTEIGKTFLLSAGELYKKTLRTITPGRFGSKS